MSDDRTDDQDDDVEHDPEAKLYSTVPLEDEDGNAYVIRQMNVGAENEIGGGEYPDPDTPPRAPAPGSDA